MRSAAVAMTPATRSSRSTRATTSRTDPTAPASSCCETRAASQRRLLLGGGKIEKMRGDPLAHRAERVDRGLLQGVIQPAVQLPGDRPGHPGIAAGSGEQRAGAEPKQARRLHRLHPDAGRAAHQHRDAQHVARPGVPDRDLPALQRRQEHPEQAPDDQGRARLRSGLVDRSARRIVGALSASPQLADHLGWQFRQEAVRQGVLGLTVSHRPPPRRDKARRYAGPTV